MVIHTVIQLITISSMVNDTHTQTQGKSVKSVWGFTVDNKDELREYNIANGTSIQVGKHCYLLCIPDLPPGTTKVEVARAVETRILCLHYFSGKYKYVKNVVFVDGFDEESKNAIENSCYKIAIVNIEMPPSDDGTYADYENEFYDGICRGDVVIGEWSNAFLMANPNYYFNLTAAATATAAVESAQTDQMDAAFQKWKHDTEIEKYKRMVDDGETEIRELQNTVNELLESLRFLSRKRSGDGLVGLKDASKSLSSFLSTLHNQYARICVSDVEFLEINKNMKLKKMVELVVNLCDDCDACQELIHSLDYVNEEKRRQDLFVQIEKMICRINHSVRKFQRLHLYAERCIFGLKNRAVFTEFASFLNTAVEIVEEVAMRNCTYTQDVEYVRTYGVFPTKKMANRPSTCVSGGDYNANYVGGADGSCVGDYGGNWGSWGSWDGSNGYDGITVNNNHYDYYENVDNVETDDDADADEEMTSVSQMLAEFDAMRALTATSVVVDNSVEVKVEEERQVVVAVNESEDAELVMAATAVKEEQEDKEKNGSGSSNGDNNDVNQNKPKGKWFSWF